MTNSIQYSGHAFNEKLHEGKLSGSITIAATGINFQGEAKSVTLPMDGTNFKLGGASDRLVFISHPLFPDWSIYTSDRSILNNPLLKNNSFILTQINKAKRKRIFNWSVAGFISFLIIALPLLLVFNIDLLSSIVAVQIPTSWEEELGKSTLAQYQIENDMMDDESAEILLSPLIEPMLDVANSDRYKFHFYIVKDSSLNAFALPGGYIVIHSGLISKADSADELLGVVAHEISHITEQHGIRNIISTASIYLIISAIIGDLNGILATIASASPLLLNQSYSRKFEAAADEKGYALLEESDINPRGLSDFFEKIIEEEKKMLEMIENDTTRSLIEGTLSFLSSHPATEERIDNLRAMWENSDGSYRDLSESFKELKTAVEQFVVETNKESTEDENSD